MQKINIHKWYLVRSALSSSFTHFLKNWKIFIPWNDIDKNAKVIFSHFWGLFEVEFRPTWHDIMLCNSCGLFYLLLSAMSIDKCTIRPVSSAILILSQKSYQFISHRISKWLWNIIFLGRCKFSLWAFDGAVLIWVT